MNSNLRDYLQSLLNPKYSQSALKVALFVGTMLFIINHGSALIQGKMTQQRWISGVLTYFIPYSVNIHGQWSSNRLKSSRSN
ncbi:nitrate/nitrite transporter NrtS [Cyanobacterium sp. Dongsha4]|uniref:nitrate/nitrite transporter NrtS n=1 Tax=Cyanobacterium sp. DS4 TaxID=2878255 RepID=UPI002E814253|nr:nitrate/nitrite transporter NrtS [Cyanobacterium sp. Dongsha4]WVL01162.1 nitrate/nitrite transporter NrtS [Cyanobacterium sp. Dongsha4]